MPSEGPSGTPGMGSMHNDVLNREPGDAAETARLVEELRQRAKGAFGQKDMPSCDALYSRAIKLLGDSAEPQLFSNRALVYLNLGKLENARDDCSTALKKDPLLLKAHYRKAQALQRLGDWDGARAAAEFGCNVEGAAQKDIDQLKALQKTIDKEEAKDKELKAALRQEAQDTTTAEAQLKPGASVQKQMQEKASAAKSERTVAKADSGSEPKETKAKAGSDMRGYKKTADGKTTSFFHMDISDEAKALIEKDGFGKPQKLDGPVEEVIAGSGQPSTWNKAGTWESKKMMGWAKAELEAWEGQQVELPNAMGTVSIKSITEIDGNVEVVQVRGKRKFVMDLGFTLKWRLVLSGGEEAEGKLAYLDVGPDDEPEVSYEFDSGAGPCRPVADAFVKHSSQGLQASVSARLAALIADFKTK